MLYLIKSVAKKFSDKKRLQTWLKQHLALQQQITPFPLMVSSDIIESLFGNFKHIIERSPQADMNRTTLLIPALCGHLKGAVITQAFNHASHNDLKQGEKENISYTVRKKREDFFKNKESQKAGEINKGRGRLFRQPRPALIVGTAWLTVSN
ncbi:MAG: hypothetical protein PSU93_06560 [Methylobacter sp.]|uniref:Uncharacterized protein n=1 Tax=Candidatus Methylobacter titanis TaxID=3053457 RepID=A0AA43Q6S3_9GAMM|nr:hypothetical protein [Candidatus Methylobacter titanis]